ncbi:hypothetical protein RIR_jg14352.t1 [Rhizophagus irregularis DAOM 181602=DAOM 197198]|nr:hypothetical protein RIR_jg14352.t1 [Rhizophagus irregularis DAOM 181602=DAOM 197198]
MDLMTLQATDNSYSFDCVAPKEYNIASSIWMFENAGIDLSTVLALGNWTSNITFQRFYQRGVHVMLEKNNVSRQILKEALF